MQQSINDWEREGGIDGKWGAEPWMQYHGWPRGGGKQLGPQLKVLPSCVPSTHSPPTPY